MMEPVTTTVTTSNAASTPRRVTLPMMSCTTESSTSTTSATAAATSSFPYKLHDLLEAAEKKDLTHIVSWSADGKAFKVHQPQAFASQIMPQYLSSMTKYKSFIRQLNLYCFSRDSSRQGPRRGWYTHPQFIRHRPELCHGMGPTKFKGGPSRASGSLALDTSKKRARRSKSSSTTTAAAALSTSSVRKVVDMPSTSSTTTASNLFCSSSVVSQEEEPRTMAMQDDPLWLGTSLFPWEDNDEQVDVNVDPLLAHFEGRSFYIIPEVTPSSKTLLLEDNVLTRRNKTTATTSTRRKGVNAHAA